MWKWALGALLISASSLCAETRVLAFSGSTRTDSVNKKLLVEASSIARKSGAVVTIVDLRDLPMPFYDADLEVSEGMPANAKRLRQLMIESQVVLIASPEYNSSVSAILKNALDWASRSEQGGPSSDAFKGKKFVLMSASPGQGGGVRGLVHLQNIIENVGGTVMPQKVSIPSSYSAFDEQGNLKDQKQKSDLENLVKQAL